MTGFNWDEMMGSGYDEESSQEMIGKMLEQVKATKGPILDELENLAMELHDLDEGNARVVLASIGAFRQVLEMIVDLDPREDGTSVAMYIMAVRMFDEIHKMLYASVAVYKKVA